MVKILVRVPTQAAKLDVLANIASGDKGLGPPPRVIASQPDVLVMEADERQRERILSAGGSIYEDVRFEVLPGDYDTFDEEPAFGRPSPDPVDAYSLRDVVEQVNAPMAWHSSRGAGVTIAVVDTGISDACLEIPAARRSSVDLPTAYGGHHWSDAIGHGTMCAAIAAGSDDAGGRYNGIAPGATVLSARSTLMSSDLVEVYDELMRAKAEGRIPGPLVVSNSFGVRTCHPPGFLPADHPFFTGILAAIRAGITVCFAAGNYHSDIGCHHDPRSCGPNTIWGPNSHDEVLSVGTVNRELTNTDPTTPHANSSRGPGEWAVALKKPDCVAPTYGEVPWGTGYRRMRWWGTSGACPQVAGAAALMLALDNNLQPGTVADLVRNSCRLLLDGRCCVGHGLLDCDGAVALAAGRLNASGRFASTALHP